MKVKKSKSPTSVDIILPLEINEEEEEQNRIDQRKKEILLEYKVKLNAVEQRAEQERQLEELQTINAQRQKQVTVRIEKLLGKQNKKYKLLSIKKEHKFNCKIQDLKKLDTFIDLEKKLSTLNIIQDPAVQRQMISIREGQKIQAERQRLLRDHTVQKQNLPQLGHQLNIDVEQYELIDDISKKKQNYNIDLLNGVNKLDHQIEQYKNVVQLLRANKLIHQANTIIQNQQTYTQQNRLTQDCFEHCISGLNLENKQTFLENSQGAIFFQGVEKNQKQREFKEFDKKLIVNKNVQEDKYKALQLYFEERGIDIFNKDKIPNQAFYRDYQKRASQLIDQAKQDSQRNFNKKSKKINQDYNLKDQNLNQQNQRTWRSLSNINSQISSKSIAYTQAQKHKDNNNQIERPGSKSIQFVNQKSSQKIVLSEQQSQSSLLNFSPNPVENSPCITQCISPCNTIKGTRSTSFHKTQLQQENFSNNGSKTSREQSLNGQLSPSASIKTTYYSKFRKQDVLQSKCTALLEKLSVEQFNKINSIDNVTMLNEMEKSIIQGLGNVKENLNIELQEDKTQNDAQIGQIRKYMPRRHVAQDMRKQLRQTKIFKSQLF